MRISSLLLVGMVACGKNAGTGVDAGTAAATASASAAVTASAAPSATIAPLASAPVTTATTIASAAPSASAATAVQCEKPTFKLALPNKTVCIKPCGADSDCARGEKCHELGDKLDPKGLYGAMFCFPPAGGATTTAAPAKCASGEALVQARYEPLCMKTCRQTSDCGRNGPCSDANDTDGKAVKVCDATGYPPGQKH